MLKNYFKTAWRSIITQRLNSLVNIGSLAVAMTAVVIIVIWVQNELSFDNYHKDADSIFLLKNYWKIDKNETWIDEDSYYPMAAAIGRSVPEAALVTRMNKIAKNDLTLTVNGKRFREDAGMYADSNWFKVFKYSFIRGNAQAFSSNHAGVVLTESKATQLFGTADVIGNRLQIGSAVFSVQAVVKDNPVNSSFQYNVILPFYTTDYDLSDWLYLRCRTFVKLRPTTNTAKVEGAIDAILKANNKADGSITTTLLPLRKMHFDNDFQRSAFPHGNSKTVTIFSALAFLLLLAAATNYVNLIVARTGVRVKEISIRKINGATRLNLFIQMMAECVVTSLLALLLTIMLVYLCTPLLKTFTGTNFIANLVSPAVAIILFGTVISVILLTGIYPALLLSSFKPVNLFGGINVLGLKNTAFKKVLVTAQFALAVFMIIASVVVYRQLTFIQTQDIAYNRAQVFTVLVPFSSFDFSKKGEDEKVESLLSSVKQDLLSKSQVEAVSRSSVSPVNENFTTSNGIDWDGKPRDAEPSYVSYDADADIAKIMHFKMVEGRWFDEKKMTDKNNYVLNETAVKQFGIKEPVTGKRFNKGVIIGVAKDFFYQSMHDKIGPVVINTGHANSFNFIIKTKPGQAKKALEATKAVYNKFFPGQFFDYSFADEEFDALYKNDQKALTFTMIFSGLSILICSMGLLGMTVFMAEQRRKEIGIRKVLGATVTSIVALLSKGTMQLVLISTAIASPIAWWAMNKWLQDYAYRVNISGWVFAIAGAAAVVIALATIGHQAIKSATANPVKSLRTE